MGTDRNNFLVQCSTAWLESVCFIILAKEIINAKIAKKRKMIKFNCLFLSWDIGAGGKRQVPPPPPFLGGKFLAYILKLFMFPR